jgi:1-acyl-sn-glycerol-3-phosphate acyltransferase
MSSLLSSMLPDPFADMRGEIRERLRHIPTELNEYGYDPFGLHPETLEDVMLFGALLYHYWFRVETHGIERVPKGRVLLISNHAGQVALDAVMIGTAMLLEGTPPRAIRGMGEFWLPTLPWVNLFMVRTGSVVGTRKNCVDLLDADEAVIAFPEGVRGMNKLYRDAYQLKEFGHGFMRLALATDTPIVPIAVIGSEAAEQYLIPTRLTWNTPALKLKDVTYPEAETVNYAFSDKPLLVFSDTIVIKSAFDVPSNVPASLTELTAQLRYQACNDKACLPPTTLDITVPVARP